MSSKSDVSKMLVSHRTPSVISASGVGRTSRTRPESGVTGRPLKRQAVMKPEQHTAVPVSAATASPASDVVHTVRASSSSAAGSSPAAAAGGKSTSYGYLQMKCLEALKRASGPLHAQELQVAVGREYSIATDRDFLSRLRSNPRVHFDPITKLWSFSSPYQSLTTPEAILNRLRTKELEITLEVLDLSKDMSVWINDLLSKRVCRAVRGTKISRCKVFSSESGLFCDLYDPANRCDGCKSLQGVLLYQRGDATIEGLALDSDIKEVWHQIPATTIADLEVYLDKSRAPPMEDNAKDRRKKKPAGARSSRVQKIANVHIYTTEEFNDALAEAPPDG